MTRMYSFYFCANLIRMQLRISLVLKVLDSSRDLNCAPDNEEYIQCLGINRDLCIDEVPVETVEPTVDLGEPQPEEKEEGNSINIEIEQDSESTCYSNAVRYFAGFLLHKTFRKYDCKECREYIKDKFATLSPSETFLLNKNFTQFNKSLKLKAPTDKFYNLIKFHIDIFNGMFSDCPFDKNIKSKICEKCIKSTNFNVEFKLWFSTNNSCFEHKQLILNKLISILLQKNSSWLADKLIKNSINKRKLSIINNS